MTKISIVSSTKLDSYFILLFHPHQFKSNKNSRDKEQKDSTISCISPDFLFDVPFKNVLYFSRNSVLQLFSCFSFHYFQRDTVLMLSLA